jgi:hypothetical protein
LKDWSVTSRGSEFTAPELRIPCLQGEVYGHPRFEDGTLVVTSGIKGIMSIETKEKEVIVERKKIVITRNTEYNIFPEDIDPEYERQYPGAYDRLTYKEIGEGESL